MLSTRLLRKAVPSIAIRANTIATVEDARKLIWTNRKHRDMGGGGHEGFDAEKEYAFQDGPKHDHHDHHDSHAHPVFHLPFSKGEAFMFSWGILFAGLGAIWLSVSFQQKKQGFTTRKDRFTE